MLIYDVLRFLAATGIVFHHSNAFLYPAFERVAAKQSSFGLALLVDLFFVISGYVIASVYGGKTTDLPSYFTFMQKRVARLWPLHLVTMFLFLIIYLVAITAGFQIGTPVDMSLGCFAKTAFLLHSVVPCDGPVVNPVNWSISAEFVMYLIFPVVFWILGRNRLWAVVGLLVSTSAILFLSSGLSASEWSDIYGPFRALPSFCFGICLFRIFEGAVVNAQTTKLSSCIVLCILVCTLCYVMLNGFSAFVVMAVILSLCAVAAFVDKQEIKNQALSRAASLGQLTYTIYMIHLLIVTVLVNAIGDKILNLSYWPMLALIVFAYAVTVLTSYFTLIWLERPLRRFFSPARKA
jgi:peptidoglycan/LPS O-acetylase OafA/YrhL